MQKVSQGEFLKVRKWMLIGVPALFLFGALTHFLFDWTGRSAVAGVLFPVNESVWEHLKMLFWPMLCWWLGVYLALGVRDVIAPQRWLISLACGLTAGMLVILAGHYIFVGAIGRESVIFDIVLFLVSAFAAQEMALHFYRYGSQRVYSYYVALGALVLLMLAFILFTFFPLHLPLFFSTDTGAYGISQG